MAKFRNYDKYEVYEDGRIWSYIRNKWLKPKTNQYGYQQVLLSDNDGNRKMYQVHRIVYETFSGEPIPEGMQVNHIDEDKTSNFFANLNLMTPKENTNWGSGIERCRKARINGKCSKAVGAFKDGKLVFTFPSTSEAGRQGFEQTSVAACCRGKLKTHKGFTWRYL